MEQNLQLEAVRFTVWGAVREDGARCPRGRPSLPVRLPARSVGPLYCGSRGGSWRVIRSNKSVSGSLMSRPNSLSP